jgi:hypothetical protein
MVGLDPTICRRFARDPLVRPEDDVSVSTRSACGESMVRYERLCLKSVIKMAAVRNAVILGLVPRIHPLVIACGMGQMDPRDKPEGDDL